MLGRPASAPVGVFCPFFSIRAGFFLHGSFLEFLVQLFFFLVVRFLLLFLKNDFFYLIILKI
jgi:hypothetical protein